jgi:ribosome biogenesis GTPase / thiamine phosphate phosphatase
LDTEITSTNPIAVGDVVQFDPEDEAGKIGTITSINKRNNYVVRVSPHNKHQKHIISSNLDQAVIFATIKSPKTSLGFIDRFIITCEAFGVRPIIVFNKIDLLKEKDTAVLDRYTNIYTSIGYQVLQTSALADIGMKQLDELLFNKITLFTGHSGVGKSTIINYLLPNLQLRTANVSHWSGKGMHTTTYAEMFDLNPTSQIIDTPGIRELGIVAIKREELAGYYKEMKAVAQQCKYNNCNHMQEPECAVQKALANNEISIERFQTYLSIRETIQEHDY